MPPEGAGLDLADLSVGYRRRRALGRGRDTPVLTGVTARAEPGELTVLIGPNGAGKSTLLRTVCGLQPALAGRVTVAGHDIARSSAATLATLLAAVLTDRVDPGLLTAGELTSLGRHPHTGVTGRLTDADRHAVDRALAAVGATELAHRQVGELSDGERQRVLTARALAQEPAVVILDEPTAFLDVPSRVALTVLLRDLARGSGRTVLASTHDLELALRVADHVWLVDSAGGLRSGAPEDLVLSGAIADVFDAEHLAFDPAHGVFTLRHPARAHAAVHACETLRPLLARALAREGLRACRPGDASEAGVEIRAMCMAGGRDGAGLAGGNGHDPGHRHGHTFTLRQPDAPTTRHPTLTALLRTVRALPADLGPAPVGPPQQEVSA